MDADPLISVIVPIYNVAPYVRKCLDSLRGQTLKQIEVICIDDGSADASGAIADEYESSEYPIFRVIHTENRGLSAARNRGIDESRSPWIMFVDSDDWVEPDFCRIPYKAAIENNADLVIFQAVYEKNGKALKSSPWNGPVGIVDEMTAHEYGGIVAWNKLYKKCLFECCHYPIGRVYEDSAVTHKLVHVATAIIILQDAVYHRISRKESIIHTHTKKNKRDCLLSAIERKDDLISYGYSKESLNDNLCKSAIGYLSCTTKRDGDIAYELAAEIVNSTNGIPKGLTRRQRIAFITWRFDKRAFYLLSRLSGRLKE